MHRLSAFSTTLIQKRHQAAAILPGWAALNVFRAFLIGILLLCSGCGLNGLPNAATASPAGSSPVPTASLVTGTALVGGLSTKPGTPNSIIATPSTPAAVQKTAGQIYDLAKDSLDLHSLAEAVMTGLGFSVLNEATDGKKGLTMLASGRPVILDDQLDSITQGFSTGMMVSLDSLLADLADHGVKRAAGPLTADSLKAALTPLVGKASFTATETLPALFIALGQERAKRLGLNGADPVLADGWLDPLQYTLLLYGFGFAGEPGVALLPAQPARIRLVRSDQTPAPFFAPLIATFNPANLPDYLVCTLYTINSSKIGLSGPASVYHRQADETSPPASLAAIAGKLSVYDPSPTQRDLLGLAGCKILSSSQLEGKTIRWSLDSTAGQHGQLAQTSTPADAAGAATVTYQAVDETTPKANRSATTLEAAQGAIQAQAVGLPDGHPKLETGGRLYAAGAPDLLSIKIYYYAP